MSIKIVKEELSRFLGSDIPEVIAIRGRWGIGKTYAWKKIFKEQKSSGNVKLKDYSYVSLFGVSTLQDLKDAIFLDMLHNRLVTEENAQSLVKKNLKDTLTSLFIKHTKTIAEYSSELVPPYVKLISGAIRSASFLAVRNTIICIDDFERKSDDLSLKNILGLISQLKEERNCKIILIYNDEYINDVDKKIYDELKEKAIDAEILYSPLPEESIDIAFDSENDIYQTIKTCSKKAGITNIRILMKIKRLSLMLKDILTNYDPRILEQAIQTTVLSCFIYYARSDKYPDIEWLKKYNIGTSYLITQKNGDKETNESAWCTFLQDYGYLNTDDFDLVIHDAVSNGYFDKDKLITEADKLAIQCTKEQDNTYKLAWELFHKNLSNNQEEVAQALYNGFLQNIDFLSVIDLNSTVSILKQLNHNDWAIELVDSFIEARKENIEIFNTSNNLYLSQLTDNYLLEQFKLTYDKFKLIPPFQDLLQKISDNSSWSSDEKVLLDSISTEEYVNYFNQLENPSLRRSIKMVLNMPINNAKNALLNIARQSSINAIRLEKYGIKPDD